MTQDGVAERKPVLELRNVDTHYGPVQVLRNVNIELYEGEMVCLLGGNASGKTTTLKTILGYVSPSSGQVVLDGERIDGLPTTEVVGKGISMVPENRRLFKRMTVLENLEIGAYLRSDRDEIESAMLAFCSTTNTVVPVSLICWMMSKFWPTRIGARPIDGSSIKSTLGRAISARPTATICCSPPERVPAFWLRRSLARGNSSKTRSMSPSISSRSERM